ncbi:hypothetical protein [Nocardia sp. NPDC047038]|uniref:hypothetical protein n=1 Tax=Nocardia sp. NPDC047038 TaxID=3154338 RepID=UPI0033C56371
MEKSDPGLDELTASVIRAGNEWGYQIDRDSAGRLLLTAVGESPVAPPVEFRFNDQELRDYYARLAAKAGTPTGESTPWKTWMVLMSTHLSEAVYKAGVLNQPCVIVIDSAGFWAEPV